MNEPFLGMIQYFAFDYAPRGWASCNGTLLPISQYSALFSLLGIQYGGNGSTTFGLPDYRGRSITGQSNSHSMGELGGAQTASLPTQSMPPHTHTVSTMKLNAASAAANLPAPGGNFPAQASNRGNIYGTTASGRFLGAPIVTVVPAGSGVPFSVLSPYLALTCCISLVGIYPSRN